MILSAGNHVFRLCGLVMGVKPAAVRDGAEGRVGVLVKAQQEERGNGFGTQKSALE